MECSAFNAVMTLLVSARLKLAGLGASLSRWIFGFETIASDRAGVALHCLARAIGRHLIGRHHATRSNLAGIVALPFWPDSIALIPAE